MPGRHVPGHGQRDLKKVGRFYVDLAYMDVGPGLYLGGTGWQTDMLSTLACSGGGYDEVKFWNLLAQVVVMPNVYVHGEYAFAADGKGAAGDPDDTWTLALNYAF